MAAAGAPARALLPTPLLLLLLSLAVADAAVNPMSNGAVTSALNAKLKKLTDAFAPQVKRELGYCIQDTDAGWDATFNFSSDPTFLVNCMKKGDLPQRVCTAAELKFYFESILDRRGKKNYVRPNKNCNLTSWIDGCEPALPESGRRHRPMPTATVGIPPSASISSA